MEENPDGGDGEVTREEMLERAKTQIEYACIKLKNTCLNLVTEALAVGKNNAESEAVLKIVQDALDEIRKGDSKSFDCKEEKDKVI